MDNVSEIIQRLPKTELHVHMAGSIHPSILLRFNEENKLDLPFRSEEDVSRFFQYKDFEDFIHKYSLLSNSMHKASDFAVVMQDLVMDLVADNVKYAEVTISPLDHTRNGIGYGELMETLDGVIVDAESRYDIKINYIIDLVRDYGPESTGEILRETIQLNNHRIVGIGLGGRESRYPCKEFSAVFQEARTAGFHLVAHAGETGGVESVREAIHELKVDRIGHGIQSVNDRALINELRELRIPLEICLSSNVATGVVPNIVSHPVSKFLQERITVIIGSDDPSMFRTSLSREYEILFKNFGITIGELRQIILNGLQSAFIPDLQKHELIRKFSEEFHQLRKMN